MHVLAQGVLTLFCYHVSTVLGSRQPIERISFHQHFAVKSFVIFMARRCAVVPSSFAAAARACLGGARPAEAIGRCADRGMAARLASGVKRIRIEGNCDLCALNSAPQGESHNRHFARCGRRCDGEFQRSPAGGNFGGSYRPQVTAKSFIFSSLGHISIPPLGHH